METYVDELLRTLDVGSMHESGLKVVVDTAGGTASVVLPTLLGRVELDALTVNGRLDERYPTELPHTRDQALQRLGGLVSSASADFGVRFDPVGERISLVDERGRVLEDGRALLVMLDLVAAERKTGGSPLPVTTTRVAEQVAALPRGVRGVDVHVARGPDAGRRGAGRALRRRRSRRLHRPGVRRARRRLRGVRHAARAGGPHPADAVRRSTRASREAHVRRQEVPTPWAVKGQVMRHVVEAAGDRRSTPPTACASSCRTARWVLVLPDPAEAVTHVWAEGYDEPSANELLAHWVDVVEQAGR